jgi:hypothetical protein
MSKKDTRVYSEVVVITIVSLVAANAWIRWLSATLNEFYPGSLKADFFVSVIITIAAIFLLNVFFG